MRARSVGRVANRDGYGAFAVQGARVAVDSAGQPAVTLTGNATLVTDGSAKYSYVGEGNLTKSTNSATGAVATYDWNTQPELSAVRFPDRTTETLAYDPLG